MKRSKVVLEVSSRIKETTSEYDFDKDYDTGNKIAEKLSDLFTDVRKFSTLYANRLIVTVLKSRSIYEQSDRVRYALGFSSQHQQTCIEKRVFNGTDYSDVDDEFLIFKKVYHDEKAYSYEKNKKEFSRFKKDLKDIVIKTMEEE